MTITPTVGRIVWFYDHSLSPTQPIAAIVTYIYASGFVDLTAFRSAGMEPSVDPRECVELIQGEELPEGRAEQFCMWMPYQVGQAKKHQET